MKGNELSKEVQKLRDDAFKILSSAVETLKKSTIEAEVGLIVAMTSLSLTLIDRKLEEIILKEGE